MKKFNLVLTLSLLTNLAFSQWKCRLPINNEGKNLIIYKSEAVQAISTCTPPQPGAISGPTNQCSTQPPFNYSVAPVVGATSYTWTLPGGWFGTSSTNTIACVPGISGNISVAATNSCGTGPAQTLSVTIIAGPQVTITPFTSSVCAGGSLTLTANGAPNYTWSTGTNNASIAITPTLTTVYHLTATAVNSCVAVLHRTVLVHPIPTLSASAEASMICSGETATLYASGAANYNWNPAATGATVYVTPTVTTIYTITGTSAFGCVNTTTVLQNVSPCTGINERNEMEMSIHVYPNPFRNKVIVSCSSLDFARDDNGKGGDDNGRGVNDHGIGDNDNKLEVFDLTGSLIYRTELSSRNEIDLSEKASGIYFVRLQNKQTIISRKIVKE